MGVFVVLIGQMQKIFVLPSGGRLATYDELKKVVIDCGGIIDIFNQDLKSYKINEANELYQTCYKEKAFKSSATDKGKPTVTSSPKGKTTTTKTITYPAKYWSSTSDSRKINSAYYLYFPTVWIAYGEKFDNHFVHCVKE